LDSSIRRPIESDSISPVGCELSSGTGGAQPEENFKGEIMKNANDFWNYRKDERMELTEAQQDPGILTGADFQIENEDSKKKARALRDANSDAGKSQLGLPAPVRNKVPRA
jgi:hypothetical protein